MAFEILCPGCGRPWRPFVLNVATFDPALLDPHCKNCRTGERHPGSQRESADRKKLNAALARQIGKEKR